jgi:hypothetical protein
LKFGEREYFADEENHKTRNHISCYDHLLLL